VEIEERPKSWILRVWLADRPGALGALATVLGTVGADVVGLEVAERGAGRVIDEIGITIPETASIEELVAAVNALEGVDVENVRLTGSGRRVRHELVSATAQIMALPARESMVALCLLVRDDLCSDWAAVMRDSEVITSCGSVPDPDWMKVFSAGVSSSPVNTMALEGVLWSESDEIGLMVGRDGAAYLSSERDELAGWATLAGVIGNGTSQLD
jgi:hypothetical protein